MQDRSPAQDLVGNGFLDHQDREDRYLHNFQGVSVCQVLLILESIDFSCFFVICLKSLHPYHQSVYHINYQVNT